MSFGLLPFDHYERTMKAGDGAFRAAAGRLEASKLALVQEQMALDEAYRRDALAQGLHISDRDFDARQPTTGSRLLAGGAGAFTGYMAGSAMSSNPYAGWIGAGIGAVSAFL